MIKKGAGLMKIDGHRQEDFARKKNYGTKFDRKVIGITGPDLIIDHGGAVNHAINVIEQLKDEFDFIFLPAPWNLTKYMMSEDSSLKRIKFLRSKGIIISNRLDKAVKYKLKEYNLLNNFTESHIDVVFNFDYHFPLENEDYTRLIAKNFTVRYGICLQGLGDYNLSFFPYFRNTIKLLFTCKTYKVVAYRIYQYLSRIAVISRINHDSNLNIILAINSNLKDNVRLKRRIHTLIPSNGMENPSELSLKVQGIDSAYSKKDQIIFVARQSYAKGTFDLKPIMDIVFKNVNSKLILIGRFEHMSEERLFKKIMNTYLKSGQIVYRGFVDDEELYNEIASSKLMIYPSHSDSFSITVLQSLSLKTPVIAYNIAGLRIYQGLQAVHLVEEFNYSAMATEVLKLLKTDNLSSLFGKDEENFIKKYTWTDVAMQYRKYFQIL